MNIIVDFFNEIYQFLFIASLINFIYILILFSVKWLARFYFKINNEKFTLNNNKLILLLLSITTIITYLL